MVFVKQFIAEEDLKPSGPALYPEPARPREIIGAAHDRAIGVMGVRAVQGGALPDAFDGEMPGGHLEIVDFRQAAPFLALAKQIGESPAALAHQYALSMKGISIVILAVKNRTELHECVEVAARGPLAPKLTARIEALVGRPS